VLGSALMATGLLSLVRLPADGRLSTSLAPSLLVLGLAIPCLFVSVNAMALGGVPRDQAALASGLLSTLQWIGGALGLALVAAVTDGHAVSAGANGGALVESIHAGFLACGALGVLAFLAAVAVAVATCPRPGAVSADG